MNNLGASEILVLFLLGLIVFGPQKLPEIARNLGKAFRAFRSETEKAARTLRDAVDEPKRAVSSVGIYDTADAPATPPAAPATDVVDPAAAAADPPVPAPSDAVEPAPAPIAPLHNPPTPPFTQGDLDVHSANGSEPEPEIEPAARELEDT